MRVVVAGAAVTVVWWMWQTRDGQHETGSKPGSEGLQARGTWLGATS